MKNVKALFVGACAMCILAGCSKKEATPTDASAKDGKAPAVAADEKTKK